ncbi:MAG: YfiR family protein [Methylococcaceae bacterium]|nr:YfiR family protein [Methylococcaceae bacterium]
MKADWPVKRLRERRMRLAVLLAVGLSGVAGANGDMDVETLKLSYLAKLPKFIEWPAAALPADTQAFTLCVLGDESLAAIARQLGQQQAQQRSFNVVDGKRVGNLGKCHILYVGNSEEWRAGSVLAKVQRSPILTISDIHDFAKQGGIVEFVEQDRHLKFEINLSAAGKAGLRVNSKLAELAVKTY